MPGTVTNLTTRITTADAGTLVNIGGGQGASNTNDIVIQGTNAQGRRCDNATDKGFWEDLGVTNEVDVSAAGTHVGIWYWVTHYKQLDTTANGGVEIWLGSSTSDYDAHAVSGVDLYPALGGWQRVWIDVDRTPEVVGGTGLNQLLLRYIGGTVTISGVGGTALNFMLDASDYVAGTALRLTGGTAPSPAKLQDLLDVDAGNTTNQYGIIYEFEGKVFCNGRINVGEGAATIFNETRSLTFAKQPYAASDFMGINFNLSNSSTDVDINSMLIDSAGSAVLGDFNVTGTLGNMDGDGYTLRNLRQVTLSQACSLINGTIKDCGQITAAGATLNGTTISGSTASSALLWNMVQGTGGRLDDTKWVSAGTGHAIELGALSPATVTFSGHQYTGYAGSDGNTGNEVVYNNSGALRTIDVTNGGQTPSVRNGTGSTTVVNVGLVTYTLSGITDQNAKVTIVNTGTDTKLVDNETVGVDGQVEYSYLYTSDINVDVLIRSLSYENIEFSDVLRGSDKTVLISQIDDRVYSNP